MEILKTFALVLFFLKIGLAQPPCLPTAGGIPAGDEPPGCFLCGPIYQGSTEGYSPDSVDYVFLCGTIENSQWINVVADFAGRLPVTILASNCQMGKGVELAIYDQNLNLISNCYSSNGTSMVGSVTATGLIPGSNYLVMIDGYEGDICDILVTARANGVNGGVPDPPGPMYVEPPFESICFGNEICFMIDPVNDATNYEWSYPEEFATPTFLSDFKMCLQFDSLGAGIISVTPSNNCFPGVTSIVPIEVSNEQHSVRICRSELPVEFNGQTFFDVGIHEITDSSFPGCDGNFQFELLFDTIFESKRVAICGGEEYWIDTFSFSKTGVYELFLDGLSKGVCDSFIRLDLNVVDTIDMPHRTTRLTQLLCLGDTFHVNNLPFYEDGKHYVVMENVSGTLCDSTVILNLQIPNIEPVQITCFPDSFLNALTINWDDRPYAEGYEFWINDSLVSVQDFRGHLYFPNAPGERLDIEIRPFASHSCSYLPSKTTCFAPDFSTVRTLEKERINLIISPNPSSGLVRIQTDFKLDLIEVFDFSGKKILTSNKSTIDLSEHPAGIYFFKIKTEEGIIFKKTIKS